jgi:hypothetical protein
MMVADKDLPLIPPPHHAAGDHLAPALEPYSGTGAAEDISAGIDRIGQQPMNRILA